MVGKAENAKVPWPFLGSEVWPPSLALAQQPGGIAGCLPMQAMGSSPRLTGTSLCLSI